MKRSIASLILSIFISLNALSESTQRIYLSGTDAANTVAWDFYCTEGRNSGKWSRINVPSNWELQGFGTYNYGHDWRNGKIGEEKGLYRTRFQVPASWRGKTIKIVFEGSMTDTQVSINGQQAGAINQGGFYRFSYDITHLVKYGRSNLLEAEVSKQSSNESINKAERQADYWIFGGIYRPVYLEVLPRLHISNVAIDARADGSFTSRLSISEPSTDLSVKVELTDMMNNSIREEFSTSVFHGNDSVEIKGLFKNVKPWNPEWPVLYKMNISLLKGPDVVHTVSERIGFRSIELRPHDGFYVNGVKVVFKGVNRHSFWPETGRALSNKNHLNDILLMKQMNMNAVRMSHYPPDKRFLELCDSLGLFVLDEVAGWQDGYDTVVSPGIIRQAVQRDQNHPSVVIWCNGNEGGWDFNNEKWFHRHDIQNRPVVYPWLLRNGMDLHHYPSLNYGISKYYNGNDPFMPTEFLHGLYDGGHGAGLEDYWSLYSSSPLHAGGFLWVFSDEAVLRTDHHRDSVYDSSGNNAPDGILGPHRQKGGSFNTIREIWSPVQVEPIVINRSWNGQLLVSNRFLYTNLKDCKLQWKAVKTGFPPSEEIVIASGQLQGPDAMPGETRNVTFPISGALPQSDLFVLTAIDHKGEEVVTLSWPLLQTWEKTAELLSSYPENQQSLIEVVESDSAVDVTSGEIRISFSKSNGTILSVKNAKGHVDFTGGEVTGADLPVTATKWYTDSEGNFIMEALMDHPVRKLKWKLDNKGLLHLEADLLNNLWGNFDYFGVSFNYPEQRCSGVQWMGRGPYRVWKNRLRGARIGVWEKKFNNTITGESFNELIYPEFKGYHGNLYWMILKEGEKTIKIYSGTPNLYFQLFTPGKPQHIAGGTYPPFPGGAISFLYEIPPIGTKFKTPEVLGPRSQKGYHGGHKGEQTYPIRLWFDFR